MDEASRSSLNIVIVTVARRFSVFRVLERDAFVDYARGVPFFTSDSIRPVRPRASHGVGPHSVGCPLCDFGGDATGSDETTRARIVWFGGAAEEGKEKIEKTFWCTLRVCFAPSGLLRAVDGENAPWPRLST